MPAELKRTCRKCGTVWYVTKKEAHEKGPSSMQLSAVRLQALGSLGRAGGHLGGLEAQKARIDARNRCSQCGSTDYASEFMPDEPPQKLSHEKDMDRVRQIKEYISAQKRLGRRVSWLDANLELNALETANVALATGEDGPASSGGMRECPYCAEEVKTAAIKCKHCGSDIGPATEVP